MNIKKVEYIDGDKKIEILIADSLESLIKADIEKYQKLVQSRGCAGDSCRCQDPPYEDCEGIDLTWVLEKNLSDKKLLTFESAVQGKEEIEDLNDHDYCQLNYRFGENNGIIYINHFVLGGDGSGPHGERNYRLAKYKRIID